VAYGGTVIRLRHSKGMLCLAHLLRHPGEQFAALDLLKLAEQPVAGSPDLLDASAQAVEAARSVVTKRIKGAAKKIEAHHPALGYHLSTTVRTGAFCSYMPDPERPIAWTQWSHPST
jgi:non-specific serine/threonine protein kinase